jgi:hypothetical protein
MSEEETQGTELTTVEPPFSTALASQQSRAVFLPANLAQAMQLAEYMASGIGVRQWMRGNPSACLALIQISMRWGMDPYIVSNKAYYANDTLSFESQLVNAVINTSGALIGRLKVVFSGEATGGEGKETLNCRVSGRLAADPDQVFRPRTGSPDHQNPQFATVEGESEAATSVSRDARMGAALHAGGPAGHLHAR